MILIISIIAGLLLLSSLLGHDILIVSGIYLFLFITQMYRSNSADRYFIKRLKIKNEDVHILYEDKGNEIILEGNLNEMTIKKENGFRTVYLSICTKNELQLRQYVYGDWTEEKFDEIEQYIRKIRMIGKEIG